MVEQSDLCTVLYHDSIFDAFDSPQNVLYTSTFKSNKNEPKRDDVFWLQTLPFVEQWIFLFEKIWICKQMLYKHFQIDNPKYVSV